MAIRLYVDEDAMDKDFVQALRAHGIDVLTALEAGEEQAGMVNTTLRHCQEAI